LKSFRFRLTSTVPPFGVSDGREMQFHDGKFDVTIKPGRNHDANWTALAVVDRTPREDLWSELEKPATSHQESDAATLSGRFPHLSERLVGYLDQVSADLSASTRRVVDAVRWRLGDHLHRSKTAGGQLAWLLQNGEWFTPSRKVHFNLRYKLTVKLPTNAQPEIEAILATSEEPVAHELLREAKEQDVSNPRSSLLMAVVAAEVGAKACITNLQPQTEWLVENMPSPPLVTLLREYFPKLTSRSDGANVKPLPTTMLETLRDAVQMRNKLAHIRPPVIGSQKLQEILATVADLLWYFDYARGYVWSLEHMSPSLRGLLKQKPLR
jgi:hypothetical protein